MPKDVEISVLYVKYILMTKVSGLTFLHRKNKDKHISDTLLGIGFLKKIKHKYGQKGVLVFFNFMIKN